MAPKRHPRSGGNLGVQPTRLGRFVCVHMFPKGARAMFPLCRLKHSSDRLTAGVVKRKEYEDAEWIWNIRVSSRVNIRAISRAVLTMIKAVSKTRSKPNQGHIKYHSSNFLSFDIPITRLASTHE